MVNMAKLGIRYSYSAALRYRGSDYGPLIFVRYVYLYDLGLMNSSKNSKSPSQTTRIEIA